MEILHRRKDGFEGSALRHSRGWLGRFSWEWACPAWKLWGVQLSYNGPFREGLAFDIKAGLFAVFLTLDITLPMWLKPGEAGIEFHHNSIWLSVWRGSEIFSRSLPWWRRTYSFDFADFLLGKVKYSRRDLRHEDISVPMPERNYHGVATVQLCRWKRPRWFARERLFTWVDMKEGIPHEGKGENSWDCGEDAIHGYSVQGDDMAKVIAYGVEISIGKRRRYGTPERIRKILENAE